MSLPPIVPQFAAQGTVPANASYASYTLTTALLQLQWAFGFQSGDSNTAALWMDVASDTINRALGMPNATQTTPGMALTVNNTGTQPFIVQGATGSALGAVQPTQSVVFVLVDNSTVGGTWRTILLGATTAGANAAQLAGPGLSVVSGQLAITWPVVPFASDRAVTTSDRATILNFTGGSANLTLPAVGTVPSGFIFTTKNSGTGILTVVPNGAELIDGTTSVTFSNQQSAIIVSNGAAWITIAGKSAAGGSSVSARSISVGGTGNYSLTGTEVAAQVQLMTGVLTGARKALYGTGVGFWFVQNNTTGAFGLTLATTAGDTGVNIPQGTFAVIASDGANMRGISQGGGGTITAVNPGAGMTGGGSIGAVTLAIAASAAGGSYGGAARYAATVVVDGVGRVTGATQVGPFALTTDLAGVYLPLTGGTISGSLTVTGNFNAGGAVWAIGIYEGGFGDTSFGLFHDVSNNRYLQYSPSWFWQWASASGQLIWNVPGIGAYVFAPSGQFSAPAGFTAGGSGTINTAGLISGGTVQASFLHSFGNLTVDGGAGINIDLQVGSNLNVVSGNGYKPGGGSWADNSARVLKENIKPYTRGLKAVRAMRPRAYNFRAETGRDVNHRIIGVLAEDMEHMPETLAHMPGITRLGDMAVENMPIYDSTPVLYALVNSVREMADAMERHGIAL